MQISSLSQLRELYAPATGRALAKALDHLDPHCLRFVALSPFVLLASAGLSASTTLSLDASPRGGTPGFVKAPDPHTLLIPDAPGNNRLDTLENIISSAQLGLLFMIPGVDETLRVNGRARLLSDAALIERYFGDADRRPKLLIELQVEQAFLHCAKALMRSRLWQAESQQSRSCLPSMGEMLRDQTGGTAPPESQEAMVARYAKDL